MLTETVFAWPGLGLYITNSLQNADMNAVLGGTIVVGVGLHRRSTCSPTCCTACSIRGRGDDGDDAAPAQSLHAWLLSDRPQSRRQARLGRAYGAGGASCATGSRSSGLADRRRAGPGRDLRRRCSRRYSPYIGDLRTTRLLPPSAAHWFGTDDQGRDILSRLIYGSRITLVVVVLVAMLAAPIGLAVGTVAGYAGGWSTRC